MADPQVTLILSVQQADLARAALRKLGKKRLRDAQRAVEPRVHLDHQDVGVRSMELVALISAAIREVVGDERFQVLERDGLAWVRPHNGGRKP